jgi:hypothetical protein
MRDIEINSDKTTVIGVLLLLALALVTFLGSLYDLLRHRPAVDHAAGIWIYPTVIFNTYVAITWCRDSKIRKAYPYGVAGFCLMAAGFLMATVLELTKKVVVGPQNLFYATLMVIDIVASGLILFEGVRWFRSIVKLSEGRAE